MMSFFAVCLHDFMSGVYLFALRQIKETKMENLNKQKKQWLQCSYSGYK